MRAVQSLFVSSRERVRSLVRVASVASTILLVGSGCQAITGSYSVESGGGPVCAKVASCCLTLPAAAEATCAATVAAADDSACTSFLITNAGECTTSSHDAGGLSLPDATSHVDGNTTTPDSGTGHDAGHDSGGSTSELTGTWTLTSATCNGTAATLNGTTTLSFSTGSAEELENLSDGCVVTETISPLTVTATAITSPTGTLACSEACSSTDCTAGPTGAIDLPYTRTGTTLTISESVATTTCSSGVYLFNFSME